MPIDTNGFKPFFIAALSAFVALPIASLAAEEADIGAATSLAADTMYKIELAAKCGTPVSSQHNLKLERFAVALDLKKNGLVPQTLPQADFENIMSSISTAESTAAIAKRAAEASKENVCSQPENIKYWNFLRSAGKMLGN
jgi:hypothetical protein